jgi:hypothetical protein
MTEINLVDPGVFDPGAVDPETAQFNSRLEKLIALMPPSHTLTPQELREERESGKGWMGPFRRLDEAEDRTVSALGRSVNVRVVVPPEVNGVYLHMHGGGFVLMRAYHFDELLVATARNSRVAVVSVDYRLAPEFPFPAGLEDAVAVLEQWLEEGVDPGPYPRRPRGGPAVREVAREGRRSTSPLRRRCGRRPQRPGPEARERPCGVPR